MVKWRTDLEVPSRRLCPQTDFVGSATVAAAGNESTVLLRRRETAGHMSNRTPKAPSIPWRESEPVIFSASLTNGIKTLVLAVMSVGLAFDWITWSQEQIAAVLGVMAAGFVVLSATFAAITHQKVTPVATKFTPQPRGQTPNATG